MSAATQISIDSLQGGLLALQGAINGRQAFSPPMLRAIWRDRLRPFWRLLPELYVGLANRLTASGENFLAIEVASEGRLFFGDLPKLLFYEALAAARSGSSARCREILLSRPDLIAQVADAPALLARTYKDAWKATGDAQFLEMSFTHYHEAYVASKDPTFPGVNAASMALLAGKKEKAEEIAKIVAGLLDAKGSTDYWGGVTRAECHLILGEFEKAHAAYRAACGANEPRANLITTRAQARLLLAKHGRAADEFDEAFSIPNIACFTGHRVDAPDRVEPRFPASAVPEVSRRVSEVLARRRIEIGFSSAANGGDIIFAEALKAKPAGETVIFVPTDREAFRRASVTQPGEPAWDERFGAVLRNADDIIELEPPPGGEDDPVAFDFTNRVCFGSAMQRARELDCDLVLIALWDGEPGARGGTSDAIRLAREAGIAVEIISPLGESVVESAHAAVEISESPRLVTSVSFQLHANSPDILADALRDCAVEEFRQIESECVVFLGDARSAVQIAQRVKASGKLAGSIGLHYGPVARNPNPFNSSPGFSGPHARRAAEMLRLRPAGAIHATAEFAAVARLEKLPVAFEYLGRIALAHGLAERPLFRLAV